MIEPSIPIFENSIRKVWLGTWLKFSGFVGLVIIAILVRDILLLSFIAVLFSVLLSLPVNLLSKKVPRGFAIFMTLIGLFGGLSALGLLTLPKLSEQVESLTKRLPDTADQIQGWFSKLKNSGTIAQLPAEVKSPQRLEKRVEGLLDSGLKEIVPATKGFLGLTSAIVFVFILSIFLVSRPENYREGIRRLIPQSKEANFDEIYTRLNKGLRHWVGGILITMTLMGTFTGVGLAIAGIDNWFLLAIITFFGTFVPYVGAITSAVPGLLIGLSQSPRHFFFACLVYLGVHILEGYVVEPLIMRRAIELKPAVLLLGQGILVTLFGIIGVIVAAPLLACIQVIVEYLYIERALGK